MTERKTVRFPHCEVCGVASRAIGTLWRYCHECGELTRGPIAADGITAGYQTPPNEPALLARDEETALLLWRTRHNRLALIVAALEVAESRRSWRNVAALVAALSRCARAEDGRRMIRWCDVHGGYDCTDLGAC